MDGHKLQHKLKMPTETHGYDHSGVHRKVLIVFQRPPAEELAADCRSKFGEAPLSIGLRGKKTTIVNESLLVGTLKLNRAG